MYLKLTSPWNPGQNDPNGATYPVIHITQVTDNRSSATLSFIFEAGSWVSGTDASGNAITCWVKGPGMLSQIASVTGVDYVNLTKATALLTTESAYQSIIRILLTRLQSTYPGTITLN